MACSSYMSPDGEKILTSVQSETGLYDFFIASSLHLIHIKNVTNDCENFFLVKRYERIRIISGYYWVFN